MSSRVVKTVVIIIALPFLLLASCFFFIADSVSNAEQACTTSIGAVEPADISFTADGSLTVDGTTLSAEQVDIAKIIIGIGVSRGFSQRDIAIAVAVSMQESNLRNLAYGHMDSLGIYQQRPSQGWGTAEQIMDPVYATNKFFDALMTVEGRDTMAMIEVGIAVQHPSVSAYHKRWKWDTLATGLVTMAIGETSPEAALASGTIRQTVTGQSARCNSVGSNVTIAIQAALSQVGVPYRWGAEEEGVGFDCSGLVRFAYKQADVELSGNSTALYESGTKVAKEDLRAGDLIYWSNGSRGEGVVTHVAIYLGNDQIVEAPRAGTLVGVHPMRWDGYVGATRPIPDAEIKTARVITEASGWQLPLHNDFYISSPFDPNRLHPIFKTVRPHNGVDLGRSPTGTEVYAANSGTISYFGRDGGHGNFIRIDHADGVQTGYAHLSRFADGLGNGSSVEAGQLIGYVGSTGTSTAPHLHFEVIVNGSYVNPVTFMQERGISLG